MINVDFISALESTSLVELTFNSKEKGEITRICAPMDYGPWARSSSNEDRYHFVSVDSSSGTHPISITPEQVVHMEVLEKKFSLKELVRWQPNWHYARDWGMYS